MFFSNKQNRMTMFGMFILFGMFVACSKRMDTHLEQLTRDLYGARIEIPNDISCIYGDLLDSSEYVFLVYLDQQTCTECTVGHLPLWEYMIKQCDKYSTSVKVDIVIEAQELENEILVKIKELNFPKRVFIDTNQKFRSENQKFADYPLTHIVLLDKERRVIVIGDPTRRVEINNLVIKKFESDFNSKFES